MFRRSFSSLNEQEVSKFTSLASEWWSLNGQFRLLHKMNPTRVEYIKQMSDEYFKKKIKGEFVEDAGQSNANVLKVLDIGCGGGILSTALASIGFNVLGIDAGKENILAANLHLQNSLKPLPLEFKHCMVEDLQQNDFDLIVCSEVIEHVENQQEFLQASCKLLKVLLIFNP